MTDENKNAVVQISRSDAAVDVEAFSPIIKVTGQAATPENVKERTRDSIRIHNTSFQARLGRKLDNIARKSLDNTIRLSSHPTDMLRIKSVRDERSQDLISRTIENAEVLPIMLPVLKDIPLRHFVREGEDLTITSLYTTNQQEYFEIFAPVGVNLDMDDLLVRIMDDPNSDKPYIMILQVTEILGTFGYSSLNYMKYFVTFYNEKLPQYVINIIKDANYKRATLGW